jgi:hypothetical protein
MAGKKAKGTPEQVAREQRARQLREQIKGSDRQERERTPRELTDDAAMEDWRKETKPSPEE